MRLQLELVVERLEGGRLAQLVRGGFGEDPVGEPRIAREEGTVEVRADHAPRSAALEAALPVVAEAGQNAAERLGARVQVRPSGVILEAGQRLPGPLALEENVSDHPPLAGDGVEREEAAARQLGAAAVAVEASEQLVSAADGEEGSAAGHCVGQRRALGRDIRSDQRLLAILSAAHVIEIDLVCAHVVADADVRHFQVVAAPRRALPQDRDVAAVGVDVQVVRVEVPDADLHAARSQYGRTNPRSETIRRSASIAV